MDVKMNAEPFPRQESIGDGRVWVVLELFPGQHLPGLFFKGQWIGSPSYQHAFGDSERGL